MFIKATRANLPVLLNTDHIISINLIRNDTGEDSQTCRATVDTNEGLRYYDIDKSLDEMGRILSVSPQFRSEN